VSFTDVGAAAVSRGLRISSSNLGRVILTELGVESETRYVPRKGKLRGYAGLHIAWTTAAISFSYWATRLCNQCLY
jgi:hypothetical protein